MTKSGDDSRLLTRGMNVISAIGLADGAVSFAYIQRKTELPKATLSRILSTLRTNEFVTFDASGKRYSLGSKLIDLFNFNKAVVFARQASKNEMQRLADELEMAVWHWRFEEDKMVPFEQIFPFGMSADSVIRSSKRLDKSAAGVAVLSALESKTVSNYLRSFKSSDEPLEIAVSRQLGYAAATGFATQRISKEDAVAFGYTCIPDEVAVAIVDSEGTPLAALSVLCDADNMSDTERHQIGRKIAFAAKKISTGPHIGPRRNDVVQRIPNANVTQSTTGEYQVLQFSSFDKVGSSPSWDGKQNCLIWIDSLGGAINRCQPDSKRSLDSHRINSSATYGYSRKDLDCLPGAVIPYQNNRCIIASREGIVLMDIERNSRSVLSQPEPEDALRRFSTAQVGPDNRIWVGSLHPVPMAGLGQGRVYAFSSDGQIERILDLERGAKGLCWSPDGEFMYLTQSESKSILRYEMDLKTSRPKNPRLFVRHKEEGTPNGLAMDTEGCIWAAIYGGWQIARYSPDGELIAKIGLPVPLPTALCFGGERYQDIFVTSCRLHVPPEILVDAPSSGALFKIPVKTSGLKGRNFRVN